MPRALAARSKDPVPCRLAPDSALSRVSLDALGAAVSAGCVLLDAALDAVCLFAEALGLPDVALVAGCALLAATSRLPAGAEAP